MINFDVEVAQVVVVLPEGGDVVGNCVWFVQTADVPENGRFGTDLRLEYRSTDFFVAGELDFRHTDFGAFFNLEDDFAVFLVAAFCQFDRSEGVALFVIVFFNSAGRLAVGTDIEGAFLF